MTSKAKFTLHSQLLRELCHFYSTESKLFPTSIFSEIYYAFCFQYLRHAHFQFLIGNIFYYIFRQNPLLFSFRKYPFHLYSLNLTKRNYFGISLRLSLKSFMVAAILGKNLRPPVPKWSNGQWLFCLQEKQEL